MRKEKELWCFIKGYGFLYLISSHGRVKNRLGLIRKISKHNGYNVIDLSASNKRKTWRVCRLVALHYVDNPDGKPYVNHLDAIKDNDYYKNLEWSTQKENIDHAVRMGKIKVGEGSPYTKLKNCQVLEIFNSKDAGKILAKKYGISISSVSEIRRGAKWSHLTGKEYVKSRILTYEEIMGIFNSYDTLPVTAKRYSVTVEVVSAIRTGKSWGWVTGKKYEPIPDRRMYNGEMLSVKQICDREKVQYNTVLKWMRLRGYSLDTAISKQKEYISNGVVVHVKQKSLDV